MEQSSILSAKFDCPVARQNLSLLATAHDCETDLDFSFKKSTNPPPCSWRTLASKLSELI